MRWFRLVLILMLASAALLLVARFSGEGRRSTLLSAVMSTPDGTACDKPCLFGVIPGEITFEQAVLLLHAHPLTQTATWLNDHTLQLSGPETYIEFSLTPDRLIDNITFTDNLTDTGTPVVGSLVDMIRLGDLLAAFSVPNVSLPDSPYIALNFRSVGITAAVARPANGRWHMEPDTPLSTVMISVVRTCPEASTAGGEPSLVRPWMGFTTIRRYSGSRRTHSVMNRVSGVAIPPFVQCQE
jgi:hypothetical protein